MLGDRDEESPSKADDTGLSLPAWGVVASAGDVDMEADVAMIVAMSFNAADLLEVIIDKILLPAVWGDILSCHGGV